jgi:hypothetical protein
MISAVQIESAGRNTDGSNTGGTLTLNPEFIPDGM